MTSMPAKQVLRFLQWMRESQLQVCVDGGWGVDALLQEQTRAHGDLDIIIDLNDAQKLKDLATLNRYRVLPGGSEANFVFADDDGYQVDVHAILFGDRGFGVFLHPDGRRWPFPASAFSGQGLIAGEAVRCLTPEAQVQCHGQGYDPTPKDLDDMQRLQERFEVVVPLALCRQ
jgi:lincosamide nucleotidyltransferase A/C/D/E